MKLQVVSRRVGVTLLRDGSVPDGLLSGAQFCPLNSWSHWRLCCHASAMYHNS